MYRGLPYLDFFIIIIAAKVEGGLEEYIMF